MADDAAKDKSALPVETSVDQRGPGGRFRGRVSPQMRAVIEIMASEGTDLTTAAQRVGIVKSSAQRAFAKPVCRALYNQWVADIRANAAQAAYLRNVHLSQTAKSEQVKLEANKWVAGVDGIAALRRVEGRMQHQHTFAGFVYGSDDVQADSASGVEDAQLIEDGD